MNDVNEDGDDKMTSKNIPATITTIDGIIDLLVFVLLFLTFVNFLFPFIIIVRDVTVVIIDLFDGSVVVVTILIFIVAYLSSNNPLLMQERRKDEGLLYRVLV